MASPAPASAIYGTMCPVTFATFVRRLGHRRWFSQVGRVMVPVDRLLSRLTRGRLVALRMPGLPCMLITTTGRRSGQPRITPLLYARDGDAFVVVASNWGQRHHPAWSTNLLADPAASVTVGGRRIPVRAVPVAGTERDRLWQLMLRYWPAYQTYAERSGREIRLFRLEPQSTAGSGKAGHSPETAS